MNAPKRTISFTRRKFLSLSPIMQHRNRAELLREVYLFSSQVLLGHYNEIQSWIEESHITTFDREEISNRYHYHLQMSKQRLNEYDLLPRVKSRDREKPLGPSLPVSVYLDNIRSAHNIGSILRTVEAFGLGEIFFSPATPFVDHPQVKKTSMGAYHYVKCKKMDQINALPRPLIVLETCEHALPIHDFAFPEAFTLAIGNEEYGCSRDLLLHADVILEIPLRGRKNSLNVANAFAIAAAEIVKQKGIKEKECYENQ